LVAGAALALPALTTVLLAVAPARLVPRLARAAAVPTAALAVALTALAVSRPGDPIAGEWLAIDVAGGLLVGVVGVVGLASVLVSPAYLTDSGTSLVSARAVCGRTTRCSTPSG
jgi:hypothetical protein